MKRKKEKERKNIRTGRRRKPAPEYTGRAQMTREGSLFVRVEGLEDGIFVKAARTRHALNGDTVRVALTRPSRAGSRAEG
ncbi:MAG: hypothetical protein IJS66_04080, partial [Bacteroidales bacterium]|nr:hypothetical protein [Bacteroidales bacterium]